MVFLPLDETLTIFTMLFGGTLLQIYNSFRTVTHIKVYMSSVPNAGMEDATGALARAIQQVNSEE